MMEIAGRERSAKVKRGKMRGALLAARRLLAAERKIAFDSLTFGMNTRELAIVRRLDRAITKIDEALR